MGVRLQGNIPDQRQRTLTRAQLVGRAGTAPTPRYRVPLPSRLQPEVKARIGRLLGAPDAPANFMKQVRRLSGVKRYKNHQLRHTFACRWLEANGSLAALQVLLRHASITTTQGYGGSLTRPYGPR